MATRKNNKGEIKNASKEGQDMEFTRADIMGNEEEQSQSQGTPETLKGIEGSKSLMDIINNQSTERRTRGSNYTEFTSKKKLFEAGFLTDEQQGVINQLKNTFVFNAHNAHRYLIITMLEREAKSYKFLIVDLTTMAVEEAPSIKEAKIRVNALVETENENSDLN